MKDKFLKKILGLFGYKALDKEYYKNNRFLLSKSYLDINKILNHLFSKNKINSLVQIGANDGELFDTLNNYIKKYNTKSLLVEPIKENFEKLKKNYINFHNITFENSVISIKNEITYLYKVDPIRIKNYGDHIPGITSFNKSHLINHGVKKNDIITEKVNTISIINLLNKHEIKELDLLFIDTEGYDGKIVNDFLNNSSLRPIIILEFIHLKHSLFKELINNLESNKYVFFSINENLICFPTEKKESINFN